MPVVLQGTSALQPLLPGTLLSLASKLAAEISNRSPLLADSKPRWITASHSEVDGPIAREPAISSAPLRLTGR